MADGPGLSGPRPVHSDGLGSRERSEAIGMPGVTSIGMPGV